MGLQDAVNFVCVLKVTLAVILWHTLSPLLKFTYAYFNFEF